MSAIEYVVLVDKNNFPTGLEEKQYAHEQNLLHRAFSIFIFRQHAGQTELLLQQRAAAKYHCPNLWTNTCCSHPRDQESILDAGNRRLYEELGIAADLVDIGWFHYNAHFDNGLSENEIDHILVGMVAEDIEIVMNPAEVQACRWVTLHLLNEELADAPITFTPWLSLALPLAEQYLNKAV
jgi:isopentenyl-diphosphate delta-isomerase type 1